MPPVITEESLKAEEACQFIEHAFRDGAIPTAGTAIRRILPPASRFSKNNEHTIKKRRVLEKLAVFFDRYLGVI